MMVVFKSFITFFVIYGIYNLVLDFIMFFSKTKSSPLKDATIVIKVKNGAEKLEGTVRSIIFNLLKFSHDATVPDILIVDLGSSDETAQIAKKLSNDYPFIYYTTKELYDKAKGK